MPDSSPGFARRSFLSGVAALGVTGAVTPVAESAPGRSRRVRFGLNYTPSRSWWYCWSDWDARSIRADLADIAALGMDHIRIMALWPELQPNASFVSGGAVDRLRDMLDMAGQHRLDVEVTVFDGAVSGFLFVPPWLIDNSTGAVTDFFTDPAALAAQRRLLSALGKGIGAHPRFLGFDLSNEIHWFAKPLGIQVSPPTGDAWLRTLFDAAETAAPGRLHVAGIDHYPWLSNDFFSRDGLGTTGTASANHTWAGWTEIFSTYGPLSTPSLHYSEYFIELIKAFHVDPHRKVWIEETGVSTRWMDPALIPQWTEQSIRNMVSCDDLWGITWWCSHEVSTALTGFNPLEYDLGVYTNDHRRKPIGATIAALVREYDQSPPDPIHRSAALVLPDDLVPWKPFLEPYMRLIDRGIRPAVVKASRSADKAYLAARGIDTLIRLDDV